jgi:hypothetical protein
VGIARVNERLALSNLAGAEGIKYEEIPAYTASNPSHPIHQNLSITNYPSQPMHHKLCITTYASQPMHHYQSSTISIVGNSVASPCADIAV